jgi:hypothetical protein
MGAYYVGLDVHSRETMFVIQDKEGTISRAPYYQRKGLSAGSLPRRRVADERSGSKTGDHDGQNMQL